MQIQIRLNTLRANPRAGNQIVHIAGKEETEFILKGKLPKILKDKAAATVLNSQGDHHHGIIHNYTLIEELYLLANNVSGSKAKSKVFTVYIQTGKRRGEKQHEDQPSHYYEYEMVKATCSACKTDIPVVNILPDAEGDLCPACRKSNTFEARQYESLADALKRRDINKVEAYQAMLKAIVKD